MPIGGMCLLLIAYIHDERGPREHETAAHLTVTGGLCRPAVPSGRGVRASVTTRLVIVRSGVGI